MSKGVPLERDVIVGSTVAQKLQPGAVVMKCECGERMVLDADQVREAGRRPSAVILCDVCHSHTGSVADMLAKAMGATGEIPPEGSAMRDAIEALAEQVERGDPNLVETHYTFDPPSAGAEIQKTYKLHESGMHCTWEWMNDMGIPVLISQKRPSPSMPGDVMVMPNDKVQLSAMLGGFRRLDLSRKPRPVKDAPQA